MCPRAALVASSVVCLVSPAFGQRAEPPAYAPPDFATRAPSLPDGWEARGVWRLDLRDVLRRSARNNLGVVLQREAVRAAGAGVQLAGGAFEPTVLASYFHSDLDVLPQTSTEGMPGQILTFADDGWSLAVEERLPTGTQLRLGFANIRSRSTLGTAVQPLNYRSTLELEITQPLLRGFSFDLEVPRVEVLRARLASERAVDELSVQLAEVVERTESAYWDVVLALQSYRVQRNSLQLARDQMELTRRHIDNGVLAPSDLISAESTLAQRELQLVEAEGEIERAWDLLRQELNLPRSDWARAIVPVDPPVFQPKKTSERDALAAALARRPEIRQEELELRRAALEVRQAENDRLPQIDLGFSYQTVGQEDRYATALDQLAGFEAPGWTLMATLSWTPLMRARGASVEIQRANQRMAQARKEQRVLELYRAVREAVRNLDTAARQVLAAARFRQLAEQSLDVEQRRFQAGTSSNFLVAQRQEEVARAQLAELGALLRHRKAGLALDRQTGRLLEARGIHLESR